MEFGSHTLATNLINIETDDDATDIQHLLSEESHTTTDNGQVRIRWLEAKTGKWFVSNHSPGCLPPYSKKKRSRPLVICPCNRRAISKRNLSRHRKSLRHLAWKYRIADKIEKKEKKKPQSAYRVLSLI
jgi:hypothetical protein